jgi:hypothetical protein
MRLHTITTFIFILLSLASSPSLSAQELNCQVTVDFSQVQGTNTSVFKTLESAIADYVNTRKWTNTQISPAEKIECKMFFTIKTYEEPTMSGDLQVQSSRPVYNSSYTTTLLNFKDNKLEFDYQEGEPLIFSENSMESNLTAIINFYVYLILGMDFDSFSPRGGDPYYQLARNVVQMAQSSGESGWKAFEDNRNRNAVLNTFTEQSTAGLRDLLYEYHRTGLDEMSMSPDKGRAKITSTLDYVKSVYETQPMAVGVSMFKDAKLDELVNLYTKAPEEERKRVYELLYSIYPTETQRLDMIKRGVNK